MNIVLDDIAGLYETSGEFKLMALTRQGLTFHDFFGIVEKSDFPLEDWSMWLRMDISTLLQKRGKEGILEPHQSERVLEIRRLLHYGHSVLGTTEMLVKWFNHTSIPLGSITPKSLLDNTFGIDIVRAELGRIEHGVLA